MNKKKKRIKESNRLLFWAFTTQRINKTGILGLLRDETLVWLLVSF